jgi:excisionase family DNA binding protein
VFTSAHPTTPANTGHNGGHTVRTNEVLTVKDVAQLLRVPISWVYQQTRKRSTDRLPGIRLGKYWRFRHDDVVDWLLHQKT